MTQPEDSEPKPWGRNKTVAILLAVLLGPFAWLYTFHKSALKFWLFFAFFVIIVSPVLVQFIYAWVENRGEDALAFFAALMIEGLFYAVFWLWVIIDMILKPKSWFELRKI